MRRGQRSLILLAFAFTLTNISSAQAHEFHTGFYPAKIQATSGVGVFKLITHAGAIECQNTFSGSVSTGPSSTLDLVIGYSEPGCKALGFGEGVPVTAKPEGCSFHLKLGKETAAWHEILASNELRCSAGKSIKLTVLNCALEVKAQSVLDFIRVKTDTEAGDVSLGLEWSGIAYTVTKDGFLCPLKATGNYSDGEFITTEGITLKGYKWSLPSEETYLAVE